ncbi:hypothetical protein BH24CHL1_BH24CHL1_00780 [soil metagenome]
MYVIRLQYSEVGFSTIPILWYPMSLTRGLCTILPMKRW